MTPLQRNAMDRLPLWKEAVEEIYEDINAVPGSSMRNRLRSLAESHERLRVELEGKAILDAEAAADKDTLYDTLQREAALHERAVQVIAGYFIEELGPAMSYETDARAIIARLANATPPILLADGEELK